MCSEITQSKYRKAHSKEINAKSARWYNTNRERALKKQKAYSATFRGKFSDWKGKASYRGIDWSLTEEYLKALPQTCHYSGIDLTLEQNKPNTISLDRIDSSKGYVEGNVVFCSWRINQAKNTMSQQEFLSMCKSIVDFTAAKRS